MELNPKVPIIIAILIIIVFLTGYPFIVMKNIISPPIKNVSPNVSVITIYKEIIVTVTPTPDGKLYFANEYESGIRKIKRPFSFFREDVSGKQDLSVHTVVYNYQVLNSFHWFNPSDYKYYIEYPSDDSKKFLFVFVQSYMDDVIGNYNGLWAFDENHFAVQYDNRLYYPLKDFSKEIRIKEFEETFTLNDDYRVGYYSTIKYYERGHPQTAGETFEEQTYLKSGKSNALDGYLIYEIPKEAKEENLIVTASFNSFGYAQWVLKPIEG